MIVQIMIFSFTEEVSDSFENIQIQTLNASNANFDDVLVDSPLKLVETGDYKPLDYDYLRRNIVLLQMKEWK